MEGSHPACPVCLDGFASTGTRTPVQLNCGHMMCSKCEAVLVGRERNLPNGRIMDVSKIVGCPLCREPIVLSNTQKHNKHMIEALVKIENLMAQLRGNNETGGGQQSTSIASTSDTVSEPVDNREIVYKHLVYNDDVDMTNQRKSVFMHCVFNGDVNVRNHQNLEVAHSVFNGDAQIRTDGNSNFRHCTGLNNRAS